MVTKPAALALWRALAFATWACAALSTYSARPPTKISPRPIDVVPASERSVDGTVTLTVETVSALGERHDEAALATLIGLADRGAPAVTEAALDGIAQIGGKEARSYLAQRLSDAPEAELGQLATALARMGGLEAHEILFRSASSARPALRDAARTALATLDTPDARAFMLAALNDEDPSVAVAYFSDCVDVRAVPELERITRDGATELRRSAALALFNQGESGEAAVARLLDGDAEIADAVLQANEPSERAHRASLRSSIARLRRGAISSGPVFDFLAHDFSSEGLSALASAAHDEATSTSAINALETRGDAPALAVLARLANDDVRSLADSAVCALVAAPDSRSRPYLLRVDAHMQDTITQALVQIQAPEAASYLARSRVSSNEDEDGRRAAGRTSRVRYTRAEAW